MTIKIYHNPRCSKSRQALGLLVDRGLDVETILYLEDPPDERELAGLVNKLGITPYELLRTSEHEYRNLVAGGETLSDKEILKAMSDHPILMQRPIVVSERGARIGRPPESILEIIE